MIYEYVFADNIAYAREPIEYDWELKTELNPEMAYVPARIRLDKTAPPTKDAIMPCRQLYCEMKAMQVAAFRKYWSTNRFVYVTADMVALNFNQHRMPHHVSMEHIKHFSLLFDPRFLFESVFGDRGWTYRLLPAVDDQLLAARHRDIWLTCENALSNAAVHCLRGFVMRHSMSLLTGEGLTSDIVRGFIRHPYVGRRLHGVISALSGLVRAAETARLQRIAASDMLRR